VNWVLYCHAQVFKGSKIIFLVAHQLQSYTHCLLCHSCLQHMQTTRITLEDSGWVGIILAVCLVKCHLHISALRLATLTGIFVAFVSQSGIYQSRKLNILWPCPFTSFLIPYSFILLFGAVYLSCLKVYHPECIKAVPIHSPLPCHWWCPWVPLVGIRVNAPSVGRYMSLRIV